MKYLLLFGLCFFNILASDAFITTDELKKALNDKNIIIIDVADYSIYKKGHIQNSIHADMSEFVDDDNPLSLINSPQIIQTLFTQLGINRDSKVVIYSHNTKEGLLNSSFLATVFIYCGFENLSILNGGYMAWVFENERLTSSILTGIESSGNFIINVDSNITVSTKYIKNNLALITMLDARSPQKYYGTKRSEGVTSIGHIPHAKSSFYMDKFLRDSTIREHLELDKIYIYGAELKIDEEVIVYSDRAISATMEFYILYKEMGFKKAKLYEASLLEWGNDSELPIRRFKWE